MANCTVYGCDHSADREGFKLYKTHWLAERAKTLASCIKCGTLREIALYGKHSLRLIELRDADIAFLNDIVPQKLLQFGIATQ